MNNYNSAARQLEKSLKNLRDGVKGLNYFSRGGIFSQSILYKDRLKAGPELGSLVIIKPKKGNTNFRHQRQFVVTAVLFSIYMLSKEHSRLNNIIL